MQKDADRVRGFEVISAYRDANITVPTRRTGRSAGYDIEAAAEIVIPPRRYRLVPTGLKSYMQDGEYLGIHIRSGISLKKGLSLINDEGIIDADYYNNPDNEGHILIGIMNHGPESVTIRKGERIAQGIFKKYLPADGDDAEGERTGGMGSTGT